MSGYIDTLYHDDVTILLTQYWGCLRKDNFAGISEGGNMLGFNIGLSLTDKFVETKLTHLLVIVIFLYIRNK